MNSSELKGYLTGLIVGDGYIDKGITKRAFYIRTISKDFIYKIKNDLESCANFNIAIRHYDAYYGGGCNHKESYQLYIKAHPYFNKKYHHFYDDNRKRIISNEALNWITPNGIANWYMCDGYITLVGKQSGNIYNRRMDICTDRYSLDTIQKIQNMFLNRFDINTSIIKRDKFYRIRIKSGSYSDFINLIKPYMVESMLYKMYLGYAERPQWMDDDMWNYQEYLRSAIAPIF